MGEEEEETISHLLCTCPALLSVRKLTLGEYFFEDHGDLVKKDIKRASYIQEVIQWANSGLNGQSSAATST